jgi:hypothetical protein
VSAFLKAQGRFAHLSSDAIAAIQAHIDERWELLSHLESSATPHNGVVAEPAQARR